MTDTAEHDPVWWQGERHRRCQRCRTVLTDADAIVWMAVAVVLETGGRELERRYRSRATRGYCSEGCARRDLGWSGEPAQPYVNPGVNPTGETT